ncbi:hypothetical protein, partial [Yoonia sp.]|uniref:hypothetical protein n=1 Tax=Yoonia sp. TaxID=2212373 RepID=UPI0035C82711
FTLFHVVQSNRTSERLRTDLSWSNVGVAGLCAHSCILQHRTLRALNRPPSINETAIKNCAVWPSWCRKPLAKPSLYLSGFWPSVEHQTFALCAASGKMGAKQPIALAVGRGILVIATSLSEFSNEALASFSQKTLMPAKD